MLSKLNKITTWQAALIIAILGFAVFFTGLTNPFEGDDIGQIVNSVPVHSISHIKLFFEGGTFYNGQGLVPLSGAYYRPLMTTAFSLVYTVFGAHPLYFHLLQLLLCIGSAIILYLFFRYSFKPALALFLSLVFLVHPIDSQTAFAIPYMQDALFFFFGILAMWLLVRFRSVRSLLSVAASLFLSMLSKETAVVFIAMSLLYLFWFNRKRLYAFAAIMAVPIGLYLALRINAVGLAAHQTVAPIDNLNLAGRLLTAPSLVLFYITKFIFPWKLASGYYWAYSSFSVRHVLLPLVIDLAVAGGFVYMGMLLRKRVPKAKYCTYLFFGSWAVIGLIPYLQIIPLDMTACETWFYFSMVGVLGMLGVALTSFRLRIQASWILAIAIVVVTILGFRTALRGLDWRSQCGLAAHDIAASKENFIAEANISSCYYLQHNFSVAKAHAERSVAIFPSSNGYNSLGQALAALGDYPGAHAAFTNGIKYQKGYIVLYDNLAALTGGYGNPNQNEQFLQKSVALFPGDSNLWMYLAVQKYRNNQVADAKVAITQAYNLNPSSGTIAAIYNVIISNAPLNITFSTY